MAMELVTGYAGKAHVTSYQDAAIQAGIVGVDNGVLSYVGQGMKAVATSANNIRIYDGVALIGGKAVVIDRDTYQDVAIANGTVGKYRNDIIYIKYTKDAFTGVESVTFDVKQGAAGNSGIDPALTTNNLYSTGTLTSEIPFKRVRLNGLAIESVENMHDNVPSLTELNRKLPVFKRRNSSEAGICTPHYIMIMGTLVLQGANVDYRQLFSTSDLLSKLKFYDPSISNFDEGKCVITTNNGDGNAAATHFYAPEWWGSNNAYYQYFYPGTSSPIRVNYCIHYLKL